MTTQHDIALRIINLSHNYGDNRVLHYINFDIARGQIVGLIGPSGCGKSTLFRAIAGTHPPKEGSVTVINADGVEKVSLGASSDIGMVYQKYTLFPDLTILENVAEGPYKSRVTLFDRVFQRSYKKEIWDDSVQKAEAWLKRVHLEDAMHMYPSQLSGGMQQRVAIAQALVMKPGVLVLDEPFGALDEALRRSLRNLLLELYEENLKSIERGEKPEFTILMITHNISEALHVGDRVLGLSQFWDWKGYGYSNKPGATIVYDKICPIASSDIVSDFLIYKKQRTELDNAVSDTGNPVDPKNHVIFWKSIEEKGQHGVVKS